MAAQAVQALAPLALYEPGAHDTHAEARNEEKVPGAQETHVVPLSPEENVPGRQMVHELTSLRAKPGLQAGAPVGAEVGLVVGARVGLMEGAVVGVVVAGTVGLVGTAV